MWYKLVMPMFPLVSPVARARGRQHPTICLVWHDFVPTERDKLVWFDTPVALFEQQLGQIERAGAHPVSLSALYNSLSTGAALPPRAVVLCFDDNTDGIFRYAAPRLQKRGWPFAVSAHTGFVGVRTSKGHNTYATLRQMERLGATIVSQTDTHPPDLRLLPDSALQREMAVSKHKIEAGLGHVVSFLTYPSGKWNTRVARFAREADYQMALTEDFGSAETSPHLLGVHRYSTHRRFDEAVKRMIIK